MFIITDALMVLLSALIVALCAICYINVLAMEKCCNWWWKFGMQFENKKGIMGWLWEPIWGCHKCNAGQMALWSYIIHIAINDLPYRFGIHVSYILLSILFSAVLNVILKDNKLI